MDFLSYTEQQHAFSLPETLEIKYKDSEDLF